MDANTFSAICCGMVGVMFLIGFANLVDFGMRTMAENKARQAENARLLKWDLPAKPAAEEPVAPDGLWHL